MNPLHLLWIVPKMNPLHLLWIVPVSASVGLWAASLLAANGRDDDDR